MCVCWKKCICGLSLANYVLEWEPSPHPWPLLSAPNGPAIIPLLCLNVGPDIALHTTTKKIERYAPFSSFHGIRLSPKIHSFTAYLCLLRFIIIVSTYLSSFSFIKACVIVEGCITGNWIINAWRCFTFHPRSFCSLTGQVRRLLHSIYKLMFMHAFSARHFFCHCDRSY